MPSEHFVGRQEAVGLLGAVLKGSTKAQGKLTIQSIEGSGGIGKTCLFDHVLASSDLTDRYYLGLKIDGNDPSTSSLVRAISRMVESAEAEAIRGRNPPGYYFPKVDRVIKAVETIKSEVVTEFQRLYPSEQEAPSKIMWFLDLAFETGKRINDAAPSTKKYVNVKELEKWRTLLAEAVPRMVSLREEVAWFYEHLGLGGSTALRNAIKENACRPLADALLSDLSTIWSRYRSEHQVGVSHGEIRAIDRLLLVIDDYEKLQESLSEFLVSHFLPALRNAAFESVVVILGRDQLQVTHPAWDQNLRPTLMKRIVLEPLTRKEMDELVEAYGIQSQSEKDRAWRDTQGYPFYVQLWIEEAESGGRSAVMLKRFYDRTTRWMNDREKGWLQLTLFLNEVNIRTLRSFINDAQEAEDAFRWFEREGSVRDTVGSVFRVREYLRSRLVDYLRISDPDRYEELECIGRTATAR